MTDKLTQLLLNSLATDVVVIPAFICLVGLAYWVYCKLAK